MRFQTLILSLVTPLLFVFESTVGAYLKDVPLTLVQPDGTTLNCFVTGDEFFHWVHDAEGYTVIRDPMSGYFVYARVAADTLASSGYVVGRVDPTRVE